MHFLFSQELETFEVLFKLSTYNNNIQSYSHHMLKISLGEILARRKAVFTYNFGQEEQ